MTLGFRPYTEQDYEAVMALELRPLEIREGWAVSGMNYLTTLALSISLSEPQDLWVSTVGGEVSGIFGITIFEEGEMGVPWFVSNSKTFATRTNQKLFLRYSRDIIEWMEFRCAYMINVISLKNTKSIRWLRWLGFEIDESQAFTYDRDPELKFVFMRRDHGKGGETGCRKSQ